MGFLGDEDRSQLPPATAEDTLTSFPLGNDRGEIGLGIGQALSDVANLGLTSQRVGIDLLVLAAHVQAADTRISRRTESQNNWTREIKIVVPVHDLDRWRPTESHIEKMLSFLTGDRWEVRFRSQTVEINIPNPVVSDSAPAFSPDQVCLFSGGLDSLIGAIDLFAQNKKPLLVSHSAEGASSSAQEKCAAGIKAHYSQKRIERLRLWMRIPGNLINNVGSENTTRGRSFLFISVGVYAGLCFSNSPRILVPENGFISLNVPLDPLRVGALSTRTTHPFYLKLWSELIQKLNIAGTIENPYWNKTKGEMLRDCRNQGLISTIGRHSSSCSSPTKGRFQGHRMGHCGYCLPCIIRRAAFNESCNADLTGYAIPDLSRNTLNSMTSEGQQVRSFQLAIKRLVDNPELAKILVLKPGPLSLATTEFEGLAGVYRRGLEEVGRFLANVTTAPV